MRTPLATLLVLSMFISTADAQFSSPSDCATFLKVDITPANPKVGEEITVALTNPTANVYTLNSACLFNSIHINDCSGMAVQKINCAQIITPIKPGQTITQDWDQTDALGNQVKPGSYGFRIQVVGSTGTPESCCPTVIIGDAQPCKKASKYGKGTFGAGGFIPQLDALGSTSIGSTTFTIQISSAVGGANSMIFLGLGQTSIGAPWGTFLVDPSPILLQVPIPLGGIPGAPGTGSASLPAAIPGDPALVGLEFFSQVLVADNLSTGGISHSEGLTFMICS